MTIKAVLFDLDGTLLDTAPDIVSVVNQLCADHGKPPVDSDTLRPVISRGARGLVSVAFGWPEDDPRCEPLREALLERYQHHLSAATAPFAGITELLAWLDQRSLPWGIVTNKQRRHSTAIIASLGWEQRCRVLVCADDVQHPKPSPEPLLLACRMMHWQPADVVYIGDHWQDIEAGRQATMTTIAVAYGYTPNATNSTTWGADFCVDKPVDIQAVLATLH